jgi:hypothetical protein
MRLSVLSSVFLGLVFGPAQADKDGSYYIAGTGNPNAQKEKMYWKDAENVLQDLDQFSELHVQFHSCAWSWMQWEDDGNDVDEDDYWYLAKIPPMAANVAFSLYGSLKGESFNGCGKNTFINTFYTNGGFTDFAKAMKQAGVSGFSSYSYSDYSSYSSSSSSSGNNNRDLWSSYSSSSSSSYSSLTAECQGGYGVGCNSNGFAMLTYSTNECNPAYATGIKDKLSNLNSAMEKAQCVQIYSSNSYSGYTDGTALALLQNSHSCFYQDYFSPDWDCPDPYGLLEYYQEEFYEGMQESRRRAPYSIYTNRKKYMAMEEEGKVKTITGVAFFVAGLLLLFVDNFITKKILKIKEHGEARKRKARKQIDDNVSAGGVTTSSDSFYGAGGNSIYTKDGGNSIYAKDGHDEEAPSISEDPSKDFIMMSRSVSVEMTETKKQSVPYGAPPQSSDTATVDSSIVSQGTEDMARLVTPVSAPEPEPVPVSEESVPEDSPPADSMIAVKTLIDESKDTAVPVTSEEVVQTDVLAPDPKADDSLAPSDIKADEDIPASEIQESPSEAVAEESMAPSDVATEEDSVSPELQEKVPSISNDAVVEETRANEEEEAEAPAADNKDAILSEEASDETPEDAFVTCAELPTIDSKSDNTDETETPSPEAESMVYAPLAEETEEVATASAEESGSSEKPDDAVGSDESVPEPEVQASAAPNDGIVVEDVSIPAETKDETGIIKEDDSIVDEINAAPSDPVESARIEAGETEETDAANEVEGTMETDVGVPARDDTQGERQEESTVKASESE